MELLSLLSVGYCNRGYHPTKTGYNSMYNWKGLTMYWKLHRTSATKHRCFTSFHQRLGSFGSFLDFNVWSYTSEWSLSLNQGKFINLSVTKNWWKLESQFNHPFETLGHLFLLIVVVQVPFWRTKLVESSNFFHQTKNDARISGKPYDSFVMPVPSFNEPWIIPQWDQIGDRGTWRAIHLEGRNW